MARAAARTGLSPRALRARRGVTAAREGTAPQLSSSPPRARVNQRSFTAIDPPLLPNHWYHPLPPPTPRRRHSCTPLDPRPALCPLRHSRAVRGRAIAHARGWSRTSGRWCLVVEGERRGGDGDWGVGAGGWWPLSLCRLPWRWRWCGDGCCGRGGGMGRSRSLCCPRSRVAGRRRWGWCSGGGGGGARGGGARGDSGGSGDGSGGLRPCRRCGGDDRWWGLRCASECLEGESRARRLPP